MTTQHDFQADLEDVDAAITHANQVLGRKEFEV